MSADLRFSSPTTVLVGDIGGTNGRFGLVGDDRLRPDGVVSEPGEAHATFEAALGAALDRLGGRPSRAALAVAGPVGEDGRAVITNRRGWTIDPERLKARFGFAEVLVINDFVAQAAALPHLDASETAQIGDAPPRRAVKAAVGPGTGLGVAALLPDGPDWRPMASEGGHVEFAPVSAREAAAFAILRRSFERISAEHVVSGPGLARLHDALAEIDGGAPSGLDPAAIAAQALGGEARASETVALFLSMLARFAGDMALTFGAAGGVYLCGGVAPHLLPALDPAAFRAAFEAKAPHGPLMREIATVVVTSGRAGLIGAAAIAAARRG